MIMLKLIDIHKTFNPGTINEKVALNGVDLHLNEGDFVTVIGGNGAGKSMVSPQLSGYTTVTIHLLNSLSLANHDMRKTWYYVCCWMSRCRSSKAVRLP